jgi:nitrous oxide reductase accessory protein NosL
LSSRAKLLAAIRNNPKDVRFADACKAAEWIGFKGKGGKGSHRAFSRPGEPVALNFQNRKGKIPTYQAKQLIEMIDKYGGDNGE